MSALAFLEMRRAELNETHARAAWLVGTSPVAPIRSSAYATCVRLEGMMRLVDASIVRVRAVTVTRTRTIGG